MSDIGTFVYGEGDWRQIHEELDGFAAWVDDYNSQVKAGTANDYHVEDVIRSAERVEKSITQAKAKVEPVLKSATQQLLQTRKHAKWVLTKRLGYTLKALTRVSSKVSTMLTEADGKKRIKQQLTAQDLNEVMERLQWLEKHGVIPRVVPEPADSWVDELYEL